MGAHLPLDVPDAVAGVGGGGLERLITYDHAATGLEEDHRGRDLAAEGVPQDHDSALVINGCGNRVGSTEVDAEDREAPRFGGPPWLARLRPQGPRGEFSVSGPARRRAPRDTSSQRNGAPGS